MQIGGSRVGGRRCVRLSRDCSTTRISSLCTTAIWLEQRPSLRDTPRSRSVVVGPRPLFLSVHDPGQNEGSGVRRWVGTVVKGAGLRLASQTCHADSGDRSPLTRLIGWVRHRATPVSFCPSPATLDRLPDARRATAPRLPPFGIGLTKDPMALVRLPASRVAFRTTDCDRSDSYSRSERTIPAGRIGQFSNTGSSRSSRIAFRSGTCSGARQRPCFPSHPGSLTSRSGTIAAALACGLPVVQVAGHETGPPLDRQAWR